MTDLVPQGFVPLRDAFGRFRSAVWNAHDPFSELDVASLTRSLPAERQAVHRAEVESIVDRERELFCNSFRLGHLKAVATLDSTGERLIIPEREWQEAFAPHLFLRDGVPAGHSDYLDKLAGHSLFVGERQLNTRLPPLGSLKLARELILSRAQDFLIGLAMDGLLSPSEAEAHAAAWGMKPLASEPPDSALDPMVEPFWTLPMAIAWILWRDPRRVRENWHLYTRRCHDWHTERRRIPLDGGRQWYEVTASEVRQRHEPTVATIGILSCLDLEGGNNKRASPTLARQDLWRRLGEGDLAMTAVDHAGDVVTIDRVEWAYLGIAHKVDGADYLCRSSLEPVYTDLKLSRSDMVRLWPAPRSPSLTYATGTRHTFPADDRRWSLFEACLWVGCEGQETLTDDIDAEGLDEQGAITLFEQLALGTLAATGIGPEKLRERIPAEYWELATVDLDGEGHYVSFVDDAGEGLWGTLKPFGEAEPRWDRILIEQAALKRIFPFSRGKPLDCRKWLENTMRDSPQERPKSKAKLRMEAIKRFGITRADFDRAWINALEKIPEAKASWTRAGRPKNHHN
ncbi:MAG: hypothetical protein WDZ83_00195 [Rhizobiaceae bacterium]